jgi:DeoR family fructose operon transcriptional repressor
VAVSVDAIERLDAIRRRIAAEGQVRTVDLAVDLAVSEMTIRRDLDALAEQGVVQRVRGGALAPGPEPFAQRYDRQHRAKQVIAEKCRPLVDDGGAIGLDASSTMQRLAVLLHDACDLTVVTNGPESFAALNEHPSTTALLTGGRLDRRTGSLVGPLAVRSARDVLLRCFVTSAAALDPHIGASELSLEEAEAKGALASVAAKVVLAVDSSKLGQRAAARCLPMGRVDVLVTELDPADRRLAAYRDVVEVI